MEVTKIYDYEFYGDNNLEVANIPESVVSVGEYAFAMCTSLVSAIIPDSTISIGDHAFYGCFSLGEISFGSDVVNIPYSAFLNTNITNVMWPSKTKDEIISMSEFPWGINEGATVTCKDCTFVIDNSLWSSPPASEPEEPEEPEEPDIQDGETIYTEGIINITIREGAVDVTGEMFSDVQKENARTVTLPSTARRVEYNCFGNWPNLVNVELNEGLENIAEYSFANTNIACISIPSTVIGIAENAFDGCDSLTTMVFEGRTIASVMQMAERGSAGNFGCQTAVFYCANGSVKPLRIQGKPINFEIGTYVVPYGSTKILDDEFNDSIGHTLPFHGVISIPPTVKEIGARAFYVNPFATKGSGEYFSDGVLEPYIDTLHIPYGVEKIGERAFANAFSRGINIENAPIDVIRAAIRKSLGSDAPDFSLDKVFDEESNSNVLIGGAINSELLDGVGSAILDEDNIDLIPMSNGTGEGNLRIPDSVTYIGDFAFANERRPFASDNYSYDEYGHMDGKNSFYSIYYRREGTFDNLSLKFSFYIYRNAETRVPIGVKVSQQKMSRAFTRFNRLVLPSKLEKLNNGVFFNVETDSVVDVPPGTKSIGDMCFGLYDYVYHCDDRRIYSRSGVFLYRIPYRFECEVTVKPRCQRFTAKFNFDCPSVLSISNLSVGESQELTFKGKVSVREVKRNGSCFNFGYDSSSFEKVLKDYNPMSSGTPIASWEPTPVIGNAQRINFPTFTMLELQESGFADSVYGNKDKYVKITANDKCFYPNGDFAYEITIAEGQRYIIEGEYENDQELKSAVVTDPILAIFNNAFKGCTNLDQLVIEGPVAEIGSNIVNGCTMLHSVTIGMCVNSIAADAFAGSSIESVDWSSQPSDYVRGIAGYPWGLNKGTNIKCLDGVFDIE